MTGNDIASSACATVRDAPEMELRFLRRIATMDAARAAARDARAAAKAYAAEHGIDVAIALGDAMTQLLERGARMVERHGRETVERDLWRILTAGGQDDLDPFAPPALIMRDLSTVLIEAVIWLWPGRIAAGKLTLLAGEPGTGKSQVAIAIAAAVTTGARWPCSEDFAPIGRVVIHAAEDDVADTMAPRLLAAGADLARVRSVSAVHDSQAPGRRRGLDLAADLVRIEDMLDQLGDVRLIVIDPITSYMGRVDSHRTTDVRSVLEPLAEMAARRRVAIIAITHPPKAGGKAMNRFVGSGAYVALARSAFLLTADPDSDDEHRRLLLPVKNNIAPLGRGLALRVEQTIVQSVDGKDIVASRIAWTGEEIARSADDVLREIDDGSAGAEERDAIEEADKFLRAALAGGERLSTDLQEEASQMGDLSWRTVRRAQKRLNITPYQRDRQWYWRLP